MFNPTVRFGTIYHIRGSSPDAVTAKTQQLLQELQERDVETGVPNNDVFPLEQEVYTNEQDGALDKWRHMRQKVETLIQQGQSATDAEVRDTLEVIEAWNAFKSETPATRILAEKN